MFIVFIQFDTHSKNKWFSYFTKIAWMFHIY